jgi:hypothetical protein
LYQIKPNYFAFYITHAVEEAILKNCRINCTQPSPGTKEKTKPCLKYPYITLRYYVHNTDSKNTMMSFNSSSTLATHHSLQPTVPQTFWNYIRGL